MYYVREVPLVLNVVYIIVSTRIVLFIHVIVYGLYISVFYENNQIERQVFILYFVYIIYSVKLNLLF